MPEVSISGPRTIWNALALWAEDLKPWQRLGLHLAVEHRTVSDEQIGAVYQAFLTENGLESPGLTPTQPVATSFPTRTESSDVAPLLLDRIDGLVGINALPDGASMTFGEGLTVIYGRNAAGKSGFARVLANVCFSRHQPRIMPNVHGEGTEGPSATFHFRLGGQVREPYTYRHGTSHPELRRISFFDRIVADQHVSNETTFEFKPAGFEVFPELARIYVELGKRLDTDITTRSRPNEFAQSFLAPATPISALLSTLSPTSDIETIRQQAVFGAAEIARLAELDRQLLALRAQDTRVVLASLQETRQLLARLLGQLRALTPQFSMDRLGHSSRG
jgi:hypothetical protein